MDPADELLLADGPAPGVRLGAWRLSERLGVGGNATVWRGTADDGRSAAVKVLAPHAVRSEDLDRFGREHRALLALHHPHIVRALDAGTTADLAWLALELVDGQTLEARITAWRARPDPARFADAERIFRELASALQHIHEHGLVHRDVKPANVLLTAQGSVKLSDFGVVTDPELSRITLSGALVGTIAYMAPELIAEEPFDHRADLYGLGAVLYTMLALERPIEADSVAGYLTRHLTTPPLPPHERDPAVPRHLERVAMRLLEKDPARRFASARAAIEALDDVGARRPLYGRERALAAWRDLVALRRQGSGALVVLDGPPGSGRTALLQVLVDRATDAGLRCGTLDDPEAEVVTVDDLPRSARNAVDAALARGALVAAVGRAGSAAPGVHDVHVLTLEPLDRRALVQLLRDHGAPTSAATALAARLVGQPSAQPGAALDQLDALVAAGWLQPGEEGLLAARSVEDFATGELPAPRGVEEALSGRLHDLEDESRELLELLALLARPAGASLLARAASRPARVPASLDALIQEGWVRAELAEDDHALSLAHPCAGGVIRRRLDTETAKARHLALAEVLGGRRRRATTEAADHLAAGGRTQDAITTYAEAARRAEAAGAFDEALHASERALTLLDGEPPDPARRRALLALAGASQLALGRWVDAVPTLEAAVAAAREQGDHDAVAAAASDLGRALYRLGRLDRAGAMLEEAIAEGTPGGREASAARRALADIHLQGGRWDAAMALFRDAMATATAVGSRDDEARARRGIAHVLALEGRLGEATRELDAADALLVPDGDPRVRAGILLRAIELDAAAGRLAFASHRCDLLLDLLRARSLGSRVPEAVAYAAEVARMTGDLDQAAAEARRAVLLARARPEESTPGLLLGTRVLASLDRLHGDEHEALERVVAVASGVRRPGAQALALLARLSPGDTGVLDRALAEPPAPWTLAEVLRRIDLAFAAHACARPAQVDEALEAASSALRTDRTDGARLELDLVRLALGRPLPDDLRARILALAQPLPERTRRGFLSRPDIARALSPRHAGPAER